MAIQSKNITKLPPLRRLEPGEYLARERISARIPGGIEGLSFPGVADLLGTDRLVALPAGINPSPTSLPKNVVPVALSENSDKSSTRYVLGLETKLARTLVDLALHRPDDPSSDKKSRLILTHGEQGALFYLLDRAGGDWLAAGHPSFLVRGILADEEQIADYLDTAPNWQVVFRFFAQGLLGRAWIWLAQPPVDQTNRPGIDSVPPHARNWPVCMGITIGSSLLRFDDVVNLSAGDRVVLDEWSHPDFGSTNDSSPRLRCGHWRRTASWVHPRKLRLTTATRQGFNMVDNPDVQNQEITAALSFIEDDEGHELEIPVTVEIGTITMPLSKALGLIPGRIVCLDREVGHDVVLRAGENIIARGVLVEQEGMLAVEIKDKK